jgi:zinc/manganese transport system substrate-binding protein
MKALVDTMKARVGAIKARALAATFACIALVSGCANATTGSGHGIAVVAAENFWGSIASQLAGAKASVHSIIVNAAQDPHSYEPTASDARALATAKLAIVNGVGYDAWASKLLAANPTPGRLTLNIGALLDVRSGDNPHRWYDPSDVSRIADAITADLIKLDPRQVSYFKARRAAFQNRALARYHALIAATKRRYSGTPVGASESIFALQAPALGLRLITPYGFMKAIAEGTEVTAQDTATAERQVSRREIKVWIFNSQNATPEVQRLTTLARARGIPVVTITETLSPASDSFQQWQLAQLQRLARALRQATGR